MPHAKGETKDISASMYGAFRAVRSVLRLTIRKVKAQAYVDLMSSLDKKSWGPLYKIVLQKLQPWMTECLNS